MTATMLTVPVSGLSHWQIQALKGVLQTAHLQANWDSYGSPAPSPVTVNSAIQLLTSVGFDILPVPYIVPVVGGGIQFEWIVDRRELELEILPDGSADFLKSEGGTPLEEGALETIVHLEALLAWLTSAA